MKIMLMPSEGGRSCAHDDQHSGRYTRMESD